MPTAVGADVGCTVGDTVAGGAVGAMLDVADGTDDAPPPPPQPAIHATAKTLTQAALAKRDKLNAIGRC